ncbi:MAG: tetratricopeptide repeat protein [Pseudomonadales bacterium]
MSDYLSEEEQLARLRDWWQRHGVSLLVGTVLVVAGIVGWRWYQGHVEERILNASDLYAEFLAADGSAREALAERIVREGEGTAYPAVVLMRQAKEAVAGGNGAVAEPLLRRALEVASAEELEDTARLRLARVLFDNERGDEALAVLGQVRGAGYRALAAELKGDVHLSRGERSLANQSYVTAMSYLSADEQRPVLEMKIADTADPNAPPSES